MNIEANKFEFSCSSDGKQYAFSCDLFAEIIPELTVKKNLGFLYELQFIKKEQKESYWPRITKQKVKNMHVKVDWDLYCDSDEEGEKNAPEVFDWDTPPNNLVTNYKERKMKTYLTEMEEEKDAPEVFDRDDFKRTLQSLTKPQ